MFYVYRLLDENNKILYVGKSKRLNHRIYEHIHGRTNIGIECMLKIKKVEFLEFYHECDMNIFEICAICKFKPPYNTENKSEMSLFEIDIPKDWNQLDIKTFEQTIILDPLGDTTEHTVMTNNCYFNKEILLNEELSRFINEHNNKKLDKYDKQKLAELCHFSEFNINEVNDYIKYNNSRASLKIKDGEVFLIIGDKGKNGFGCWKNVTVKGIEYIQFNIMIDDKTKKSIYGKTKKEVAEKTEAFLKTVVVEDKKKKANYQIKLAPINPNDYYQNKEPKNTEENNAVKPGGINKMLYQEPNDLSPTVMLTEEQVKENLHIKSNQVLRRLMQDEGLPFIKIGRNNLFPLNKYNEWILTRLK